MRLVQPFDALAVQMVKRRGAGRGVPAGTSPLEAYGVVVDNVNVSVLL